MSIAFQIKALDASHFEPLFGLSKDELAEKNVMVYAVDAKPGFPCRVGLEDAAIGEEVLLLNYEHLSAETPFQSKGPIFVKRHARTADQDPNQIPQVLKGRPLSVRGYDRAGMMIDADVAQDESLEPMIQRIFGQDEIEFIQIHFARRGCYACRVERI